MITYSNNAQKTIFTYLDLQFQVKINDTTP